MNELQEYTASIPDSNPNKAELIRQWKIKNKWGQQEVVETPVEEVKTNGAAETDAAVVPTPEASESSDSGNGTSYSMFNEEAIASQNLDIINQRALNYKEQQDFDNNVDGVKTKAILKQLPLNSTQRTDYYIDKNLATDDTIDKDYYNRATGVVAPNSFLIDQGEVEEKFSLSAPKTEVPLKSQELKGSDQIPAFNNQDDPLGLDKPKKQVPDNFFEDLTKEFESEKKRGIGTTESFIDGFILENDLDLKYENLYFNQKKSTNFVDNFYGGSQALKEIGVNPIDFEGFLIRNGYADDYFNNLKEGEYENTSIYGDDNKLAEERHLRKYLNLYINSQDSKVNKLSKLEKIKKDPKFKTSTFGNSRTNVLNALDKVEDSDVYITTIDQQKQKDYLKSQFARSTKKDKEYLQAKVDYAKELDQRGDWYAAAANAGTFLAEGGEGFLTGMRDLSNFGLEIAGFDLAVDKDRNYQAEEQLAKDSSYYTTITDAKTITKNGVEYAKDSKGNIYNVSAGYNTSGILDDFELKALDEEIEKNGVKKTHNSLRGYLTVGGNVTGNVVSQVIGQKGFGAVTKAAKLRTLASVNGFKSVKDYNNMVKLSTVIGGKAKPAFRVPVKKSTADAMLFQGSYGGATGYNNTLAQAKAAGFNDADAEALAYDAGQYMAVWYAATGPISDRTTWLDNVGGKLGIQKIIAKSLTEAKKTGTKNFSQTLKNQLTNLSYKLKSNGYNFAKEGGKETLQENAQQAGEFLWINPTINTTAKVDFLQDTYSNDEIISTSVLSFATGGLLSQMKVPNFKPNANAQISNYTYLAKNAGKTKIELDRLVESGFATQAEADQLMENAKAILNQTPKMPKWLGGDYVLRVAQLMQQKQDIENQKKSTAPSFHGPLDDDIENLDLEIDAFVRQSANEKRTQLQKGVNVFVDAVAKASNKEVDMQNFETTAEANAYRQELEDKGSTVYQSENYGDFVLDDKTGDITVIIDDQVNTEDNVVTTEVHEGGHILVSATVKKDPKAAAKLGNSLLEELASNSNIEIKNDRVAQKIAQYVADGVSTADVMEEVLMFTSQALIDGDIVFNETAKTKIGDVIRRTLQNVFGIKVKFKSGESVVNFLRDYNKTIESGKASKGLVRTAVEGAKVTIKDSDVDAAKKLGRTEVVVNEETGIAEDIEVKPIVEKESSKASQRDVSPRGVELTSLVKEGLITNEGLVDIINSPSSKPVDKFGAIDAVVESNWPVISNSIKFNPTGSIPIEAVKTAVTEQIQGIFPGRKKELFKDFDLSRDNKVTTILGPKFLGMRQAEILQRASEIAATSTDSESIDSDKAKQVIDTSTTTFKSDGSSKKTIAQTDATSFGPAKNKKQDLESIIQVKDVDRPNFKTLSNKYFNEVAENLFGIEGKKVRGNASLKYGGTKGNPTSSEANTLQNVFKNSDNVRSFIKTMPEYNVATKETIINEQGESIDVSRDTYGRALGINSKVLEVFYDEVTGAIPDISSPKGRSLGKTSQTQVYKLKPEFKGTIGKEAITKLQSLIGITPAGELSIPVKGPARTEFGSALTGLSKMYVDNVINTIGRSKLDSKQAKADLGAGKPKSMASKRITTEAAIPPALMTIFKDLSTLRNKKQLAAKLEFSSPPINESNRKAQQDLMLEAVKAYGLDTATMEAGMMGSGGRQSFYGNIVDGKFVKKSEENGGKKYVKTTDGEYILENSKRGRLKGGEVTNWVAKPGRLYYGNEDPAFQALIKETKKYEGKKAKRVGVKGAFTEKSAKQSEINMGVLDHVVNQLADAVAPVSKEDAKRLGRPEKGMSLDIAGAIIIQSYQATSGLVKISAPFKYKSTLMEYAGLESKVGQRTGEKFREEHNPPASVIGAQIMFAIKYNAATPVMKAIKENYYQTQLSKKDDNKLDMAKLDATLVEGQTIFDNPISRLAAAGIDLQTLVNPLTGKTIAEESGFGIDPKVYNKYNANEKVQASIIQNEAILEGLKNPDLDVASEIKASLPLVPGKSMASKRNSNLIPESIEYSEPITVQKAINALEKTDKALANGRKLNQPVKKIRVFDFDDTLARTKSNVLYTMPNFEGGFSEGSTKLKAIFMVGGPGAGKTNVGKGLQLGRRGYKVVNQDIALEAMKAESGLPAKESDYTAEQRSTRSKLGAAARKAAVAKFDKYAANGDGMVIDGTGASYKATTKKIKALQEKGYEVHMVVANTPLETALERNRARTERSLPDFVVQKTYDQVQESLAKYKEDFGGRLYEINTEAIQYGKPLPGDFLQEVYAGINFNKVGKIDAATFAKEANNMEAQGAEWNFSEFSKVMQGSKGPLLDVAKIIADKRGTKDVFVLTARPANAAGPIKEFLASMGLDIPLANITGLGDGTPQAKAGWIMGKAAEGYNDFYFADDHTGNVKAVKDVLSQIDVKSKVQLAKASKRQTFDTIVNDMIEDSSGIETYKNYSAARAKTVGANKGRFNFFIPPSAEDFTGLLYKMLGKGKKGDAQMAFLKANLLDPYDRAESAVTQAKISAANDFKALKTELKTLPTSLSVPTGIGGFTYSHAVRTAIWTAQGMDIPGLSKRDIQELNDFVQNDPELRVFANELIKIQKGKPYPKPGKDWLGGNITSDIINDINKVNRAEYQQEWRENVDIIFSEDNMNKMEAAYGTRWREAMEDSLRRMKSGSNRPPGGNRSTDAILDWLNNSVGAVMFLNTRSALLQTLSMVNFINWGDNNIAKAGAAFANQKQFWSDFMTLMNSDYLVERRNGLKINVSESEIADAVRDSGNKVKAAIAFLLSKGFVMTRFADSFAIAAGGSTFYRNRVKSLVAKGMDQKAAEAQAFEDFRQIAEESQQSSNPNRISAQQASAAGRVILAWANTPMQYARIQKRAAQDLINGRGDWRTNVSKIVYYGAIQNLIFNALQQAVFALGFGEDDEEKDAKKNEKISRVANGMIDSQLKGLGIGGAAVLALKSTLMELGKQHAKKRPEYDEAVFDLLNFSPPLGSKVQKIRGGLRSFSWNMEDMKEKGFSLDNPSYLAGAQVVTGLTNVPLDRVAKKINNVRGIVNEESALWQKVALGLGWSTWDVGLGYYGGFDAAKVLTPEEEKVKEIDDMKKLTKTKEQVDMLLDLGLSKKEIKALGKEQARVEKIIELQNAEAEPKKEAEVKEEIKEETKPTSVAKPKPTPKPKVKTVSAEARLRRQFDSIKDENKPDQVKTLLKFGLSKKEIRDLKYEKNRVEKILELMPKNK